MNPKDQTEFSSRVERKESLKLRAQRRAVKGIWFGFGMFGLIGWSVVVPTLAGALLGIWLDKSFPGKHSWTLSLLLIGLIAGCVNAWHWIDKEDKQIQKERQKEDE
jgi:ATP synthase protein I